jgi:hypothetical protein
MVTYDAWPAHNHGPSEGRGMDCGEKPIGWCIRIAKDAELAELRAEVERLRGINQELVETHNVYLGHVASVERLLVVKQERAEAAEAKVARVEALMAHLHTDLIHISDLRAALDGAE